MAMEQVEVPSRSYFIRWVECSKNFTISWSIKPHKKSLNFGIFRHPRAGNQSASQLQPPPTAKSDDASSIKRPGSSRARSNEGDCIERLHAAGLLDVYWHGKVEAERVTTGTYQVKEGGMFALVFDNTFSKQVAKTATLVLLTYPSTSPPPASHALHHFDSAQALGSTTSLVQNGGKGPGHGPSASVETFTVHGQDGTAHDKESVYSAHGFHTGVLKKRKRKRHQGYARRFFSLDFTSSTLSYYLNRESSALRGAIPLSLAAISASGKEREICIDSGAEVWHLRANSDREWEQWKSALEKAAQHAMKAGTTGDQHMPLPDVQHSATINTQNQVMEDRGWAGVEALVGRVAGVRDAVRRLATAAEQPAPPKIGEAGAEASTSSTSVHSLTEQKDKERRRPFWKRKASGGTSPSASSQSLHPASAVAAAVTAVAAPALPNGVAGNMPLHQGQGMSGHLNALLTDLDSVVADFSKLVAENKQRRWLSHRVSQHQSASPIVASRVSIESSASEEFFDAEDAMVEGERGGVVLLNDDEGSARGASSSQGVTDDEESDEEDEGFDNDQPPRSAAKFEDEGVTDANGMRELSPLPLEPIERRAVVPAATVMPPSLIGFLRKNVGRDLSTIAMPVSANEPTSLLQRLSEQLEYSELLDEGVNASAENGGRLLYVAAFATSSFSNSRVKERSIRKPFNPMLGETYELVREDKGFRFIAEKVSHRPVIMACQAESQNWTFTQSPMPTQKFWGKSAELNTSGRVRIHFPSTGDSFSWTIATSFLRNIIAGEKYVEPVGSMTIHHENTGEKAIVTFKANKGMFAGRSEEVTIQAFDSSGNPYPLSLSGKWTEKLMLEGGSSPKKFWEVKELVENAQTRYGFTKFAAALNEITPIEQGKIPTTDTRHRPDQRMVEEGRLDEAEAVKMKLEEAQRVRRKEMEDGGETWQPRWFVKVREYADEEIWKIKTGKEGYWEQRSKGEWKGVPVIFEE
ncbi:Oxysterol-binding protein-domain-containing protein [Tuber brumale]|nr:Oxysterol-binding protein-domain-containing protein [Tuber brumale]